MDFIFDKNSADFPLVERVEGIAKVTGKGKYSAEYEIPNILHGVVVGSTIPAGTIINLNTENAQAIPGVIDIISHLNKPSVPGMETETARAKTRFGLPVFQTDKVYFNNQPIALVVAETLEDAMYAASLVTATYEKDEFRTDFSKEHPNTPLEDSGKERGTLSNWENAEYVVDEDYTIKMEVHNPMEMHATIAHWTSENELTLYDKNQGVNRVQDMMGKVFDIPSDNVHVISEFVGGGFGSGLRVWPNTMMAAMAAKQLNRPVKVVLTRPQMFSMVGYRPESWQRVKIGADKNGTLLGVLHQSKNTTSVYEYFMEGITRISRKVYDIANVKNEQIAVLLNLSTPTWMRGPGDSTGSFAIECAIDELSYKLNMDPVALRLANMPEKDPESGLPFSSHYVADCIKNGAKMIGWEHRNPQPNQSMEGDWKVGYGMGVGLWNAGRSETSASIEMNKEGDIIVRTAMTDIGTGTGTAMLNISHETTGIPREKIKIQLGDSKFPAAPSQGGSRGLASISGAVVAVSNALKLKLADYAKAKNEVFANNSADELLLNENGIYLKENPSSIFFFKDIWEANNLTLLELEETSGPGEERREYAIISSAAHFVKVKVHQKTGKVIMQRMVCVVDAGKIVNEKAAANQIIGAAVGGIGMALLETQEVDHTYGRLVGEDFAGYHVTVQADAPIIEVSFIGIPDPQISSTGAKGLGEVGLIGCAPAIANAIYHATGKRLRDLPITPDKILMA